MIQKAKDTVMSWLICLVPVRVCRWFWEHDVPMGGWAPHVFGRMLGVDPVRVEAN